MDDFLFKYNQLDDSSKLVALKFIDYLYKNKEKIIDLEEFKKKVLNFSVWTDEDILVFDQNRELFKQWVVAEW